MIDFSDPANFFDLLSNLQAKLDKLGLVITLKEPSDAMLRRGWHCIDFDRPEYVTSMIKWDQSPPHKTSMKADVRDAFMLMNEEAQAEIRRRLRPASRNSLPTKRIRRIPPKPQP